jgi:hypothetical protein
MGSLPPRSRVRRFLAKQAMNRGLDIANGLQKSPRRQVFVGWTSCFCVSSSQLSGREAYILDQGIGVGVSFLFLGRYSGQGLRNHSFCQRSQTFSVLRDTYRR